MSVLKNLRALSEMQFYKTAITIRKELTIWLLKDFGTRRNAKSVNQVIKDITPEEQAQIDEIFARYGRSSRRTYQSEYPDWFVEFERKIISENLAEMVTNITQANSIFPYFAFEWDLRAAGYCHKRKENTDNKIKKRLYFLKNALSFYNFRARGNYSRKSDYNTRAAQAAQTQSAAR